MSSLGVSWVGSSSDSDGSAIAGEILAGIEVEGGESILGVVLLLVVVDSLMIKPKNSDYSIVIDSLLDAIDYDPNEDDFILWNRETGRIIGRYPTKEDALMAEVEILKPPDPSNVTSEGKIQIKGELLPISEYEEMASLREFE